MVEARVYLRATARQQRRVHPRAAGEIVHPRARSTARSDLGVFLSENAAARKAHHADNRGQKNRGGDLLGVGIIPLGENIVSLTARMISDYSQRNGHERRSASAEL